MNVAATGGMNVYDTVPDTEPAEPVEPAEVLTGTENELASILVTT